MMTAVEPRTPQRATMTAKIMSLCASGSREGFVTTRLACSLP